MESRVEGRKTAMTRWTFESDMPTGSGLSEDHSGWNLSCFQRSGHSSRSVCRSCGGWRSVWAKQVYHYVAADSPYSVALHDYRIHPVLDC